MGLYSVLGVKCAFYMGLQVQKKQYRSLQFIMKTFGHGVQHPYLFPVTAVCRSLPSIFTCCCQINFFKHSPALSGSLLQSFQFFSLPTGLSAESFGSRKALHVLACSSPTPHEVGGNTAARPGARPGPERRADAPLREVALGGPDGLLHLLSRF